MNDSEVTLWNGIINEIVMLGTTTWASMPMTLCLAWYGFIWYLYIFVALKLCVVALLQLAIRHKITSILMEVRPKSPELMANAGVADVASQPQAELGAMFMLTFRALKECVVFVLGMLEAVDPDTDAMTPGNAQQSLDNAAGLRFRESWADVPVVGPVIAFLGLPGVLSIGLLTITIWQIRVLMTKWSNALESLHAHRRPILYGNFNQMADCSSLLLLASYCKHMWLALDVEASRFGGMRVTAYWARVPEMVFQAWFTVSVLELIADQDPSIMVPVLCSIIASIVASLKSFFELAWIVRPLGLWYSKLNHSPWYASSHFVYTLVLMVFHFLFLLCIGLRLAGVWACESHEFELRSLSCSDRYGIAGQQS